MGNIVKLSQISDIINKQEQPVAAIYHVEVDDPDIDPPEGLKEIGFILKLDQEGEIDENLLDAMISYRQMHGISVLLEVLAESPMPNSDRMATMATNIEHDISLLPPELDTDELWSNYINRVVSFAPIFTGKHGFAAQVFPLQSYAEYLHLDVLGLAENYKPKAKYILDYFVSKVSPEREYQLKSHIREGLFDAVGGEEKYRTLVYAATAELFRQTENAYSERYRELEDRYKLNEQAYNEQITAQKENTGKDFSL